MRGEGLTVPEPREVDPKDFQRITYRGVGLAAFTPFPRIRWRRVRADAPARKVTYRGVGLAAFNPNPNIVRRSRSPRVPTVTARKSPVTITVPPPSDSVSATLRRAIDDVERARDARQVQRLSPRGWLRDLFGKGA